MLKTIVWATDGSQHAERALPYAKALLNGDDALLVAVHIVEEPEGDTALAADSDDIVAGIRGLVSDITEKGLSATTRIVSHIGQIPAHAIADVAREVSADAIVVGTRGHSPAAGVVVGSVTQQLLSIARCPVFAVPPSAPSAGGDRQVSVAEPGSR